MAGSCSAMYRPSPPVIGGALIIASGIYIYRSK
jgi:hypothetical protein